MQDWLSPSLVVNIDFYRIYLLALELLALKVFELDRFHVWKSS